jgi:phage-related protein
MMNWLWDGLKKVFSWLFGWLETVWNSVWTWVSVVWGFITGAATWLYEAITGWVSSLTDSLGSVKSSLENASQGNFGSLGEVVGICNAWFPLSELIAALVVWLAVSKALVLYRFVKSWIPLVSS